MQRYECNFAVSYHLTIINTLWKIFVELNFCYQALKAYICGLTFVVYPEHVIIVAYCVDFRRLIVCFGVLRNKNNENLTQRKCLAIW